MCWINEFGIQEYVSLKKYNSFRVGGNARYYFEPESKIQLIDFIRKSQHIIGSMPIYWLGLGSNTLFPDGDNEILVIRTRKLDTVSMLPNNEIYAECGLACAKLSKKVQAWGFRGGAFFVGIPGTIGGALKMNAGAFGGQTWENVTQVEYCLPNGTLEVLERDQFKARYREITSPKPGWFLSAQFSFETADDASEKEQMKQLLIRRNTTQPIGTYNCGSVFKNPKGQYAAQLIESCGLKGTVVGQACISNVHANFIENTTGECKSQDILSLMKLMQEKVFSKYGVLLEPEVIVVGSNDD
jgi:UDP-N-acetylmuramate dehydrogenase|tara:strand:- start:6532 stop:7428 length:897 start_codon:yes stop_codon:yes gene_type:complete